MQTKYSKQFSKFMKAVYRPIKKIMMKEMCMHVTFFVLFFVTLSTISLFVLSRVYIFQHEYNVLNTERLNEEWLFQQCEDDNFYHQMKHHSQLCDEIAARQTDSVWLEAIKRVAGKTYLCGEQPCVEIINSIVDWCLGRGFLVVVFFLLFMLLLPTCFFPIWHVQNRNMLAMRRRYMVNDPYARIYPYMDDNIAGDDYCLQEYQNLQTNSIKKMI